MTAAEKVQAKQSPVAVEAAVAYASQTAAQRAQISGEGWRRMLIRYGR